MLVCVCVCVCVLREDLGRREPAKKKHESHPATEPEEASTDQKYQGQYAGLSFRPQPLPVQAHSRKPPHPHNVSRGATTGAMGMTVPAAISADLRVPLSNTRRCGTHPPTAAPTKQHQ